MNRSIGATRRMVVAGGFGLVVCMGYLAPILAAPSPQGIITAMLLGLCAATGVLWLWRSAMRLDVLVTAMTIVAAWLVAMSVPLSKDGFPEVRITATGQKNPASKSSEVFVRLVSEPIQGVRNFEGVGWEKRGDVFVSYQNQPNSLRYRGAWSSGAVLRFVRHAYSGMAEVSVGGKTQHFDLFSEKDAFVDVTLPESAVSWKGYVQRVMIALGLGVLLTAVGMTLARASAARGRVLAMALLAGCASLWLVKDRSYVGTLEVVAFTASSEPARVEMDAGHGFTSALTVPMKGGAVVTAEFAVPNPADWKLGIEGGSLRHFREMDVTPVGDSSSGSDNGCPAAVMGRCVYEVQGVGALRVWLQAGDAKKILTLPPSAADRERLFLLVEREPGRIAVSASRAYLQLFPWEHVSSWIKALRVVGQDGKAAGKLVRVLSDGAGGYQLAQPVGADGTYKVPALVRSDSSSFVAMKVFSGLIGASIVLLVAAVGKIALTLAHSFREGRRVQVVASVLGCLGWLGLGVAVGWPAIIGWDGFSPYIQAQTGSITLWYGLGYPMIVGGFLLLGSGPLVSAWSVLATAVLLLGASALLLRRGSTAASWLAPVLLCVALPFTVVMLGMMTHLRDAMNGLMLALFAFCGFYAALKWKTWADVERNWALGGLLLGGTVLALLRIDNTPTLLVLAGGLAFGARGFGIRPIALVAVAAACWIGVGVQVERFAVPDREGVAREKRLYSSTAVVNPLVGMLVYGKGRIPDALYTDIHDTLDKVMDADVATQLWSPYNIVYWHETHAKRGVPSIETSEQLSRLYRRALKADPVLFIKLRLATFGAMLGHDWFELEGYQKSSAHKHPSFHDHLVSIDPHSRHLSELFGYAPTAHAHPEKVQALLRWESKFASSMLQLIVCVIVVLRFRRSPLAAVVALAEIVRAGVFFLFAPASVFLYLYDLHLLGFLLPMLAMTEQAVRMRDNVEVAR